MKSLLKRRRPGMSEKALHMLTTDDRPLYASLKLLLILVLLALMAAPCVLAQTPDAAPALRATLLYGASSPSSPPLRFSPETAPASLSFNDQKRDPWLGFDKVQHLTFSFLWTLSSQYAFVNKVGASEGRALPLSLASGAGIGLSKEWYDRRYGSGLFSVRDLVADAVGLALAAGVILL
jgi:uncharacterized protein YfiM (DUF2279 family)